MSDLLVNIKNAKDCPLCLKPWLIVEEEGKNGRVFLSCLRPHCMISIWVRDPLIGKWDRFEKVECPHCRHMMRFFCRSDQYCKWYCPKCHTKMENEGERTTIPKRSSGVDANPSA